MRCKVRQAPGGRPGAGAPREKGGSDGWVSRSHTCDRKSCRAEETGRPELARVSVRAGLGLEGLQAKEEVGPRLPGHSTCWHRPGGVGTGQAGAERPLFACESLLCDSVQTLQPPQLFWLNRKLSLFSRMQNALNIDVKGKHTHRIKTEPKQSYQAGEQPSDFCKDPGLSG